MSVDPVDRRADSVRRRQVANHDSLRRESVDRRFGVVHVDCHESRLGVCRTEKPVVGNPIGQPTGQFLDSGSDTVDSNFVDRLDGFR